MATLTATPITTAGIVEPTLVAVTSTGDKFLNTEREFVKIKNGHATQSRTVSVEATHKCTYNFSHSISVTVAAGATELIGPYPSKWFSDSTDYVNLTYSDSGADLTIAVLQLP
jgi:hypothetical protein